jgi:hypothetical protein
MALMASQSSSAGRGTVSGFGKGKKPPPPSRSANVFIPYIILFSVAGTKQQI